MVGGETVRVFVLDEILQRWRNVSTLGDQIIFLSRTSSVVMQGRDMESRDLRIRSTFLVSTYTTAIVMCSTRFRRDGSTLLKAGMDQKTCVIRNIRSTLRGCCPIFKSSPTNNWTGHRSITMRIPMPKVVLFIPSISSVSSNSCGHPRYRS
ncbi:hypothetical protein LINPERPRIM_LOCUS28966 [Linum perenne]